MRTTTCSVGAPGKYARRMQHASQLSAARWTSATLLAAAGATYAYHTRLLVVAAASALVGAWCWTKVRKHLGAAGRQSVGANSERVVARALKRAGAYYVINNATLPGASGDADHVVLTSRGCAVVETKSGGGAVRIGAGAIVTGKGRRIPGDPIGQVLAQAAALRRLTGQPVRAIVCIPWMSNKAFTTGEVTICSAPALPAVLAAMGGQLSAAAATHAAASIRT